MKRWETRGIPWLRVAEGEYGKRLLLHFRPRMADWMYVIMLGILPLTVLILMVANGIPIANTPAGPQTFILTAFFGVTIVFVGALALGNLLKHWCLLDFRQGGPVKKRKSFATEEVLIKEGLEELRIRYFVTGGRNVQHVCVLDAKVGETTTEVHRCYGRQANVLADKLTVIVRESGFQKGIITA